MSCSRKFSFELGDADRYGRTQIMSAIEEKMLQDGVAIAYVTSGEIYPSWRVAEAAVPAAKHGIWAKDDLLLTPLTALHVQGGFHVVEGTITPIYEGKSATYLNFGEDWHSDFSITLSAKLHRSMKDRVAGLKEGYAVRVRGSIIDETGPMMRLNHADNLEIL
jgi:hypothetical protein